MPGTGPCPLCGAPDITSERYPRRICGACAARAVDEEGRQLRFGAGAGFFADVLDGGEWRRLQGDSCSCVVDGRPCVAFEDYWSSVCVQLVETIELAGRPIPVREIARPDGWSCRVLVDEDGGAYLEYLVSVGPYKIDAAAVHLLSREEFRAFESGDLDLGVLARDLTERG